MDTISDLIAWLEKTKAEHGDLPVRWDSLSHTFPPDPVVRDRGSKVVILNS